MRGAFCSFVRSAGEKTPFQRAFAAVKALGLTALADAGASRRRARRRAHGSDAAAADAAWTALAERRRLDDAAAAAAEAEDTNVACDSESLGPNLAAMCAASGAAQVDVIGAATFGEDAPALPSYMKKGSKAYALAQALHGKFAHIEGVTLHTAADGAVPGAFYCALKVDRAKLSVGVSDAALFANLTDTQLQGVAAAQQASDVAGAGVDFGAAMQWSASFPLDDYVPHLGKPAALNFMHLPAFYGHFGADGAVDGVSAMLSARSDAADGP